MTGMFALLQHVFATMVIGLCLRNDSECIGFGLILMPVIIWTHINASNNFLLLYAEVWLVYYIQAPIMAEL